VCRGRFVVTDLQFLGVTSRRKASVLLLGRGLDVQLASGSSCLDAGHRACNSVRDHRIVVVGASPAAAVRTMSRRRVAVENVDDASVADSHEDDTVSFSLSSLFSLCRERADNVLILESRLRNGMNQ
jgi:hypothetical protein